MDEKKLIDSDDFAKRLNGALAEFANRIEMPIEKRLRLLMIVTKLFQYQPEVDAKPVKHGHWIEHGTDEAVCSFSECSVCGTYIHMCHKFCEYESENYCPHCGSRMDEPVVISYTLKDGENGG